MITAPTLTTLLVLAGLAQVALILASLAIPHVLGWRAETAKLRPLTRQVFWTYAGYIWTTNLCFGLLSTFGANLLIDGSRLGTVVSAFIAAYWGARLALQLFCFDTSEVRREGPLHRLAEVALTLLFASLTAVYVGAAVLPAAGLLAAAPPVS